MGPKDSAQAGVRGVEPPENFGKLWDLWNESGNREHKKAGANGELNTLIDS